MPEFIEDLNSLLKGPPYSIPNDDAGTMQAVHINGKSAEISGRISDLREKIERRAVEVDRELLQALRVKQIYESNAIENIIIPLEQTKKIISESLRGDTPSILESHTLRTSISSEPKIKNVLGLKAAYEFADEITKVRGDRIREVDIRGIHQLMLTGNAIGGSYKSGENKISGSSLRTSHHADTPRQMRDFTEWVNTRDPQRPLLTATTAHAWLTHIHPFEDGNGRVARIIANMIMSQAGWPPLIIKSKADRGEYIEALSISDEGGNLLPLLQVFVKATLRSLREMEHPGFIEQLIEDDISKDANPSYPRWLLQVGNL